VNQRIQGRFCWLLIIVDFPDTTQYLGTVTPGFPSMAVARLGEHRFAFPAYLSNLVFVRQVRTSWHAIGFSAALFLDHTADSRGPQINAGQQHYKHIKSWLIPAL
jgi:hypothetical protein